MQSLANIAQRVLRVSGVLALVLGGVIWAGRGEGIVPIHMILGLLVVVSLWTLSGLAIRARVGGFLAARGFVWGAVIAWFGMMQRQLLPGDVHWVIRVLHLVVGLIAIGFGEALAARIRRGGAASGKERTGTSE